jgi:hypothetical protein
MRRVEQHDEIRGVARHELRQVGVLGEELGQVGVGEVELDRLELLEGGAEES